MAHLKAVFASPWIQCFDTLTVFMEHLHHLYDEKKRKKMEITVWDLLKHYPENADNHNLGNI